MVNARRLAEERYNEQLRKERELNERIVKTHFDKIREDESGFKDKTGKRARQKEYEELLAA